VNVLKAHLRITVETLLAKGASQREIERRTGVDRKTIRRYTANSPGVATGSVAVRRQLPWPKTTIILAGVMGIDSVTSSG
jgi:transposase